MDIKQLFHLTEFNDWQDHEDCSQRPTDLLPAIPASIDQQAVNTLNTPLEPFWLSEVTTAQLHLDSEESTDTPQEVQPEEPPPTHPHSRKPRRWPWIVLALILLTTLALIWRLAPSDSSAPTISAQSLGNTASKQNSTDTNTGTASDTIQVYVLGAVVHPGVYTLPANARIYQLLQAAGGPLPNADLVSLNLAARLTDGQEVYVQKIGETQPGTLNTPGAGNNTATVTSNQLVNINTATEAEMEQALHISSATAAKIIAYRTQHGAYTTVAQLLQVISQSIYDRIKNMVMV